MTFDRIVGTLIVIVGLLWLRHDMRKNKAVENTIMNWRAVMAEDQETIELGGQRLEVGDWVTVAHSPNKRDGFTGKIAGWWVEDGPPAADGGPTTIVTAIDVWGGKAGYERMRSIRPERVKPIKQKKGNNK